MSQRGWLRGRLLRLLQKNPQVDFILFSSKTWIPGKDLPGPTDHIPADISVNKEQLKAVLKLAVEGKTGTYKHDPVSL